MGSETTTYKDLQIQRLMSKPEEAYKQYMLEAFKQIRYGMRHVNANFQTGMIDTRSLYNDGFLKALGYNPSEKIKYTVLDPARVLTWLRTNISPSVENNVSAQWRAPTLEELALEHLQDTYSGMILAEKSFLIDGVRWYLVSVTSVSSLSTDATCYKDKWATVTETISPSNIVYIEDRIVVDDGVNCWAVKVTTSSELRYIPVEYITIPCPGPSSDIIQPVIDSYNNKIIHITHTTEPNEMGERSSWEADVRMSVYVKSNGTISISGTVINIEFAENSIMWNYADALKASVAIAVAQVREEINLLIGDRMERLVATYTLYGISKLIIAEVPSNSVTTTANAKAYPIIPIKQNYQFVNASRGLKVVLQKIGLNRKDFKDPLADTRISTAALMFVLDAKDTASASTKTIFETITTMLGVDVGPDLKNATSATKYSLDIKFKAVNMSTTLRVQVAVKSGKVSAVGKYTRSVSYIRHVEESGEVTVDYIDEYHSIRKQLTEDYYEELTFLPGSITTWEIGGYTLESKNYNGFVLDSVYIPVVDVGLKTLKYKELHYVIARSLSMVVLSIVVVKSKWYQTMFFQAIMFVVIVIIIYFTGGILMGMLAFLGMAGVDLGVFGQILTVVMAIYTMGTSLAASGFALTTNTLLTSAQTLTSLAVVASDISTKGAMKALEDKSKETQAALQESDKLTEEIDENTSPGLWMGIDDRLPDMLYLMSSTDVMCNNDLLYDYDSVIDSQIRSVGV